MGHGCDERGEVAAEAGQGGDPPSHPGLLIGGGLLTAVGVLTLSASRRHCYNLCICRLRLWQLCMCLRTYVHIRNRYLIVRTYTTTQHNPTPSLFHTAHLPSLPHSTPPLTPTQHTSPHSQQLLFAQAKCQWSKGHTSIKVVSPEWVLDCTEEGQLCSEDGYHPNTLSQEESTDKDTSGMVGLWWANGQQQGIAASTNDCPLLQVACLT